MDVETYTDSSLTTLDIRSSKEVCHEVEVTNVRQQNNMVPRTHVYEPAFHVPIWDQQVVTVLAESLTYTLKLVTISVYGNGHLSV